MKQELKSIIDEWGDTLSHSFGSVGSNIRYEDRRNALYLLFEKAIADSYSREDIEFQMPRILEYCMPEKKEIRTDKWLFYAFKDFIDVLDVAFPEAPSSLNENETFEKLKKVIPNIKPTKEGKRKAAQGASQQPRSSRISIPENIGQAVIIKNNNEENEKGPKTDDTFNIDAISDEKKNIINDTIIKNKIKELLTEQELPISDLYKLSKEEIEKDFIPPIDSEIKDLLGVDDDGNII